MPHLPLTAAKGKLIHGKRAPRPDKSRNHLLPDHLARGGSIRHTTPARQELQVAPPTPALTPRRWSRKNDEAWAIPRSTPARNFCGDGWRPCAIADEHSPTTLDGYSRCIEMATREIGHLSLEKLGPAQLDDAYARLRKRGGRVRDKPGATRPLTARTVLHVHRCLHTAFEQARKWKLIATNPAADATPPSPGKSKVKAFTADQVKRLLAAAERDPETFAITALFLVVRFAAKRSAGPCFRCARSRSRPTDDPANRGCRRSSASVARTG